MASKILERQRFNNAFLAKLVKYIVSFYVFQYMETKKTYFAYVTLNDYIILFNHHIITAYMFMEIIWKQKKLTLRMLP